MDPALKAEVSSTFVLAEHEPNRDEGTTSVENNTSSQHVKPLSNLSLNTHKAGMQGLDATKINAIIRKASEGSRYFVHKQQAQQRLDAKIKDMLRTSALLSPEQLEKATKKMETVARQCEEERDLSRTIVHVDMDMFYAAVEMRDQPHLRSVPMAVGSNSMLSTSNYVARQFGVRAGMPGFIGRQLCPQLVLVPPNFSKYKAVSKVVQEVFACYDPNFAMMSLDEAYLDITEYIENNSDGHLARSEGDDETFAEAIVREMRRKIQEATELTASAGIAPNARLAKVCSDLNKPDGQYYLPPDVSAIMDFINSLPIRKISGIGNVMEQQLKALGISLCGELRPNYGRLRLLFSESSWHYFLRISLGLGETDLTNYSGGEQKSISTETTFAGTSCRQKLLQIVSELSEELHDDMVKKRLLGKLVTLKTKTVDFVLKTRSTPLGEPTNDPQVISHVARKLLIQEIEKCSLESPPAFRLLGVRMSNLSENNDEKEKQVTISKMFQKIAQNETNNEGGVVSESETQAENVDEGPENKGDADTLEKIVPISPHSSPSKKRMFSTAELREKPKYICPVCGSAVQTKFLSTFNRHIDSCLESRTESLSGAECTSEDILEQPNVSHLNSMHNNDCNFITSNSIDNVSLSEVCNNLSPCLTVSNSKSEALSLGASSSSFFASRAGSLHKKRTCQSQSPSLSEPTHEKVDENCSVSVSNRNELLLCPVCNCAAFSSNESLNKHLDGCLMSGASAACSESSNQHSDESFLDSSAGIDRHTTNTNLTRLHERNDHKMLAASQNETKLPVEAKSCDSSSSKSVDYSLSIRNISSSNLKRKMKPKIPSNNKRKAAGVDIPITNFFS